MLLLELLFRCLTIFFTWVPGTMVPYPYGCSGSDRREAGGRLCPGRSSSLPLTAYYIWHWQYVFLFLVYILRMVLLTSVRSWSKSGLQYPILHARKWCIDIIHSMVHATQIYVPDITEYCSINPLSPTDTNDGIQYYNFTRIGLKSPKSLILCMINIIQQYIYYIS